MKLLKKWQFWVGAIVLVSIIIGVIVWYASGNKKQEIITDVVQRGQLIQTVDASGELNSIDRVDLSFESSGTLEFSNVKVGDEVKPNQVLLELSAKDLRADVDQAQFSMNMAQATLSKEIAGASNETIAVSQADVTIAEANLQAAQTDLENTKVQTQAALTEAEITVDTKSDNLDNVLIDNQLALSESREDFVNAIKSAMIEDRSAISAADRVLGVENTIVNDDFESVAKSLAASTWDIANSAMTSAISKRNSAETLVFALSSTSDDAAITAASTATQDALRQTSLTMLYTRQILDYLVVDTPQMTLAEVISLKTVVDTARTSLQTEEAAFFAQKQAYESSDSDAKTLEDNARNALSSARQALTKAQADSVSQVANAESTLTLRQADLDRARASLAQIKANPRKVDLAALQADVSRASANLDAALARLAKAQIISPIAGRVTEINYKVGEQVPAQTRSVVVQTTSEDQFKVVINVAESDIAKVSLEDDVAVTFDAFGDSVIFPGEVSAIDPAEVLIDGVVYYQIDVFLTGDLSKYELRPGMTADAVITTAVVEDALYVPQRAVLERTDGGRYVRIPKGKSFVERDVEVGLRADGGKLQILNGVEQGEKIIVSIRDL